MSLAAEFLQLGNPLQEGSSSSIVRAGRKLDFLKRREFKSFSSSSFPPTSIPDHSECCADTKFHTMITFHVQ